MKVVGNVLLNGKEWDNKGVPMTVRDKFSFKRGKFKFSNKGDLFKFLGISIKHAKVLISKGYSFDEIWDFTVGELKDTKCFEMAKLLNLRFYTKLDVSDLDDVVPYRTFFTINALADYFGVSRSLVHARLDSNWSIEDAVTIPAGKAIRKARVYGDNQPISFTFRGINFKSISQFSRFFGYSYQFFKLSDIERLSDEERNVWLEKRLQSRKPNMERQLDIVDR